LEVDAIAHAANTDLRHGGGVASAIARAAGEALERRAHGPRHTAGAPRDTRRRVTVPLLLADRIAVVPVDAPFARRLLAGEPEPERPWAPGFPLESARPALRLVLEAERAGGDLAPFGVGVVQRLADGLLVGDAGYHGPPDEAGEVEIGYALVPAARGEGLGGEVARVLTEFARSHPAVRAVTARVEPDNAQSLRVLERLGFAPDGRRGDLLRYVLRR